MAATLALLLTGLGIAGCSLQPLPGWQELWTPALAMFPPGPSSPGREEPIGSARALEALKSPDPKVRSGAIASWAEGQCEMPPAAVADAVRDPDPRVRVAALGAVARRRPPNAEQLLVAAVEDQDLQVRVAAIAALGEVGGAQARAVLERSLTGRGETVRKAAVSALGRLGVEDLVLRAKADSAWRVRLEVAKALAQYQDPMGAAAAGQLLNDPSPAVQLEVLASVGHWPLRQSGPILLEALAQQSYQTRGTAARRLAAVWPPAAEFPVDAQPLQRAEALARLQERFRREIGFADPNVLAGAGQPRGAGQRSAPLRPAPVSPQELAEVGRLLGQISGANATPPVRDDALRRLDLFGPGLLAALEQLALQDQRTLPEAVYRDLLAARDPVFAAVEGLRSEDLPARRRAADRLAELARERPPGRLATLRLAAVVAREPDPLVWRSVLAAVSSDGSEPAVRLAYMAIGHPVAEIRRRACEHLAAHPTPKHADALLPALADANTAVAMAAARALGAMGRLENSEPLKRVLASPNESLRVEAATALAQLNDPSGPAALERLAYSRDPMIRRQVATAMGQVADPTFAPTLVRLLDDQYAVRLAALESLPKVVEPRSGGPQDRPSGSVAEQIQFWKQAVLRQRGTSVGRQ